MDPSGSFPVEDINLKSAIMAKNNERADRAQDAIDHAYKADDLDTQITDLLTDLMHLAHQHKLSFTKLLATAKLHYTEEN